MEASRLVNLRALVLYREVDLQCREELLRRHTVEVANDAVVVEDRQLACGAVTRRRTA